VHLSSLTHRCGAWPQCRKQSNAAAGVPIIDVVFEIDSNGILNVEASDKVRRSAQHYTRATRNIINVQPATCNAQRATL
jgi:molecular chaperone DnaK (HSP70)